MAFPALGRENLAVACHLVGGRDLGLLKGYILEPDREAVPALGAGPIIAIQICLGANVGETMGHQTRLAIVPEEAIERLDVGIHG